ncbi:hypothetical protein [Ensifer canadensis]|uniref:hypothetical protein n=1 Tax=Ensifer canadensis TaxID=555315 RepID=UPI0035E3CBF1
MRVTESPSLSGVPLLSLTFVTCFLLLCIQPTKEFGKLLSVLLIHTDDGAAAHFGGPLSASVDDGPCPVQFLKGFVALGHTGNSNRRRHSCQVSINILLFYFDVFYINNNAINSIPHMQKRTPR